jgi:sulfur transfer complex TusBCD TusB component (DsrH family)
MYSFDSLCGKFLALTADLLARGMSNDGEIVKVNSQYIVSIPLPLELASIMIRV